MDSQKPNPKNSLRLQKYLADCGFGSRRSCEKLIGQGVVSVDGETVSEQGVRIDPNMNLVRVKGKAAQPEPKIYLMLNKPRGYLCTNSDPQGRKTYKSLLPNLPARTYTVGRLDFDSEGLLIVTNDGELCNQLIHPSHEMSKVYSVLVSRAITKAEMHTLRKGMKLRGEFMRMAGVSLARSNAKGPSYRITLKEGKNRQIRRMLNALGIRVKRLRRLQIGPLKLGDLELGSSRPLTAAEIASLKN